MRGENGEIAEAVRAGHFANVEHIPCVVPEQRGTMKKKKKEGGVQPKKQDGFQVWGVIVTKNHAQRHGVG